MLYFNLRPDFITVLLHNNLARLQIFVIILNCVRISDHPRQAQDVNAALFDMNSVVLIILLLWSIYKVVCYFHENGNHWFNLCEEI